MVDPGPHDRRHTRLTRSRDAIDDLQARTGPRETRITQREFRTKSSPASTPSKEGGWTGLMDEHYWTGLESIGLAGLTSR